MTKASTVPARNPESSDVERVVLREARDHPELGQAAVAERLRRQGHRISASGVRYIWQKHGLETAVKRLEALVAGSEEGLAALTEGQRQLLARGALTAQLSRALAGSGAADVDDEPVERRRLVLNAAAELFSERGYEGTSIRDIARQVGLLPGSVYHHFPSKEELFLAVHREGFNQVIEKLHAAVADGRDPWERLRRACTVHVECIVEGSAAERITGHDLAPGDAHELLAKIRPLRDAYENVFREVIEQLPLAPAVDRRLVRLFLLGAMNWVYVWYRAGRRRPRDIAAELVRMVRSGIAAPDAAH